MGIFDNVVYGFHAAFQFDNLLFCAIGVLVGTLLGVLPGIGPVGAMALLSDVLRKELKLTGPVRRWTTHIAMNQTFSSFLPEGSSNWFGLRVGHTYLLPCLLQDDLSSFHAIHYKPPL